MGPKVAIVYGTRPEAIKVGPVVEALRERGVHVTPICTGQHTDLLRGTGFEKTLELHAVDLTLPSHDVVDDWILHARKAIRRALRVLEPTAVLVQGDTMSAYAGAMAAHADANIPVIHLEAGIRSGNLDEPKPEEYFRVQIDRVAKLMLCASFTNATNLFRERARLQEMGLCAQDYEILVTGNSVVDAVSRIRSDIGGPITQSEAERIELAGTYGDYFLFTMHRREWRKGAEFATMIAELTMCAKDAKIVWPMHPAVKGALTQAELERLEAAGVEVLAPASHAQYIALMKFSKGIITDSGGTVEEAALLAKPVAIVRNVNDRPEAVDNGFAHVFGAHSGSITRSLEWLIGWNAANPAPAVQYCFGRPGASEVCAKVIEEFLNGEINRLHRNRAAVGRSGEFTGDGYEDE